MPITLSLPDGVMRRLEQLARKAGASMEELVIVAVDKTFHALDPSEKPLIHLRLCEKYLHEAKALLERRDSVQASEKAWGAASQIVKALAAKEGRELWEYISELRRRRNDPEASALWSRANTLHINLYEDWMPLDEVEPSMRDVERLVEKLRGLMS
jgi:hypothetical protein